MPIATARSAADPKEMDATPSVAAISVCICTYRRPELLERLLRAISVQRTDGILRISCVVVDNDEVGSALGAIERLQGQFHEPIRYAIEPVRNIALVRNRAVSMAQGELVAFIDDDETPEDDWLLHLLETMRRFDADAVLGPVRPHFEVEPPAWLLKSRMCERPSYPTGTLLHWTETRTGNVLFRASVVRDGVLRFDPSFGSGGEDIDLFRRAAQIGKRFVWCEEAPVFEVVPEQRLRRRYHLQRALLQGCISLRYATEKSALRERMGVALKTLVAAIVYTIALPVLFLAGEHLGMKYLIKDCHHISRLGAMLGIRRAAKRNF